MEFFNMPDIYSGDTMNEIYRKLLDQVPDLVFKIVWDRDKDSFQAVYISTAIDDILELSYEQFKNDPSILLRERVLPEYHTSFLRALKKSRKSGAAWKFEFRVELPLKGIRWLKVTARPETASNGSIHFFGRVSDITDAKRQERKLEVSEERYHYALKAASEGIWDWDVKTNKITFSAQSMKIIGMEETESIISRDFWKKRVHPEDRKNFDKQKNDHFKGKTPSYENIYRILSDTGSYKWVISRGRIVQYGVDGAPLRCLGTLKDITQLKEKELELAKTIDIIGSQNSRLLNFAHIVSHNLRSHAGNLKMLLDLFKTADSEEREEMLRHLEAISDGLYITIGHLKELVEIQFEIKTVKESLNLRHYLKNILNILHNEITKHGVKIEINIPLDITVNYNPAYLESILLNFTTNAIKYSSSERSPMISYDFEVMEGKKTLSISDNGLGLDLKKHKNALFGMYKTFHKNQNSRGIGLFITKNQIEAMGGTVEVVSEVNKGTTFKIYFNEEY